MEDFSTQLMAPTKQTPITVNVLTVGVIKLWWRKTKTNEQVKFKFFSKISKQRAKLG